MLIHRTCLRALNFLLDVFLSALLLYYVPKTDDVVSLLDMLVVFCFSSTKQGIECSPKGFPSLLPETKAQEFLESLRQDMCGGKFDKEVDEFTTEQVAGEKKQILS